MHGYIDFNIDDHREDYHHMQTYSFVHCLCCYQKLMHANRKSSITNKPRKKE